MKILNHNLSKQKECQWLKETLYKLDKRKNQKIKTNKEILKRLSLYDSILRTICF